MLLKLLNRVSAMRDEDDRMRQKNNKMEKAYLARNQIALIKGKYDDSNLQYVTSQMKCKEGVRYVEIQMAGCDADEDVTDQEMREFQRQMYECCTAFLKDYAENCVFDASADEKIYDVGLIFFQYMAEEAGLDENAYLNGLVEYLGENLSRPVTMLVGKKVQDISLIARSYGNACMLRSFQGFRSKKDIYFYEEEVQVSNDGMVLCKKSLDDLLKVVEQNNHMEIRAAVDRFYGEMSQRGLRGESMTLNINYLLFQLIHLASEQDDEVNQEEILRLISESSFETGTMRGSKTHLMRFACEYGDYLSQLRKNVSRGVLGNVEKEIKEHYADNLTLKGLSEKYYVNSAYLGQLFRKKYGQSFKDYLNNYRMDQAVDLLLHSDKKIIQVAEEVGYHDLDYFVNRFIQVKGCTPAKFRKQMQQ
jgi:response regulator containing cheY-like receiver domain and araC-type DNA-binding domain